MNQKVLLGALNITKPIRDSDGEQEVMEMVEGREGAMSFQYPGLP